MIFNTEQRLGTRLPYLKNSDGLLIVNNISDFNSVITGKYRCNLLTVDSRITDFGEGKGELSDEGQTPSCVVFLLFFIFQDPGIV